MANQLKVWLDLFAGILAGLQILVPETIYKNIDNYLLGSLAVTFDNKGALHWKWIIGVILVSVVIITLLLFSPVTTDLKNGHIFETVILIIGLIVGMMVITLFARLFKTAADSQDIEPLNYLFGLGLIFGITAWYAVLILTKYDLITAVTFLVAFATGITLMAVLFGIVPAAQKFLTFQSGVLLRIGVVLFIIARIIEFKTG